MSNAFASGSSSPVTYRPYEPRGKRPSTSSLPASPPTLKPTNSSPGLVRPAPSIEAPQPFRPLLRNDWASSTQSLPPLERENRPSSTSNLTNGRPTPPLAHSAVPVGISPSLPSSPRRVASPVASPSVERGNQPKSRRAAQPYRSKFQPPGMTNDRTDDFLARRKALGEGKKLEEGRLGRRLEKIISLHFPPPEIVTAPITTTNSTSVFATFSDFGNSLRGKSAKTLWDSVSGNRREIELAEQSIVKWQEDNDAVLCPICTAQFGLKTRRHHCRLCGRVVCFLPPTTPSDNPPTRRERCSTFVTYEYDEAKLTAGGEKNLSGALIEIETVEVDLSLGAVVNERNAVKVKDERTKVRVCRNCLDVVLRQQIQSQLVVTPTWLNLYEVLLRLEKEIESALPQFQELVVGLQNSSAALSSRPSSSSTQNLRKSLLTNLASYDTISKRIRALPLAEGSQPGGSQDRLQQAISAKGTLFLTQKLTILRTLGNIDDAKGVQKKKVATGSGKSKDVGVKTLSSLLGESGKVNPDPSGQLAVLLEQEALVEMYVADANAKRHFEDAASLGASLVELREEIKRVRAGGL